MPRWKRDESSNGAERWTLPASLANGAGSEGGETMKAALVFLWLLAAAALSSCATPPPAESSAERKQIFVIAANSLAAEAGMKVLRRGGSAVDAAVAVEAMLSLVEPQSSGLGGGAFLTHYQAGRRAITVYDGRETAP